MTDELLQQILAELKLSNRSGEALGFCDPPRTRRIYCNSQYGSAMYFWIGGDINKPEVIQKSAILCQVKSLSVLPGEYKSKPTFKLIISVQADQPYQLVMGLETLTCKTALLGLLQADLAQPVKFSFSAGKADNALFCDVYQHGVKLEHSQDLNEIAETIVLEMIETISRPLSDAELSPIEEELEPLEMPEKLRPFVIPTRDWNNISIAPVPEAEPEPQKKPSNENSKRIKEVCELLGMKGKLTAEAYKAAAPVQGLDKPSAELSGEECSRVIDEILAQWGLRQKCFKAINHARSAFVLLMESLEVGVTMPEIVVSWKVECDRRLAEKSQEVPAATW